MAAVLTLMDVELTHEIVRLPRTTFPDDDGASLFGIKKMGQAIA
jgi:hypothetical protein